MSKAYGNQNNKGNVAHYQRIPLDQQKSQFSRMLAKLTDDMIEGFETREKTRLMQINDIFLNRLRAEQRYD